VPDLKEAVHVQSLEAHKTALISNATVAHPLIPPECFQPYDGSIEIKAKFRDSVAVAESCLHVIVQNALEKCVTVEERVRLFWGFGDFFRCEMECGSDSCQRWKLEGKQRINWK
jgi:hypothetical protein